MYLNAVAYSWYLPNYNFYHDHAGSTRRLKQTVEDLETQLLDALSSGDEARAAQIIAEVSQYISDAFIGGIMLALYSLRAIVQ